MSKKQTLKIKLHEDESSYYLTLNNEPYWKRWPKCYLVNTVEYVRARAKFLIETEITKNYNFQDKLKGA